MRKDPPVHRIIRPCKRETRRRRTPSNPPSQTWRHTQPSGGGVPEVKGGDPGGQRPS
jgi:hypothetical protein